LAGQEQRAAEDMAAESGASDRLRRAFERLKWEVSPVSPNAGFISLKYKDKTAEICCPEEVAERDEIV
jgi:hypothetical protein